MRFQAWVLAMSEVVLAEYECPVLFIRYEDLMGGLTGSNDDNTWKQLLSFILPNITLSADNFEKPYTHCNAHIHSKRNFHGYSKAAKVELLCESGTDRLDSWFVESDAAQALASVQRRHQRSLLQNFGYSLEPPLVHPRPKGFLVNSLQSKIWFDP